MGIIAENMEQPQTPWRADALIISLVAFAHLVSHFFQLLLPPLFPWLRTEFGLSYTEMGFIMTVLFAVSGLGQAAAGFIVDRYGALRTMICGLGCLAAGALVLYSSQSYGSLLLCAVLIGLGNAVFHPVDFSLINHRVSAARLGPAYAAHGISGSLGWASAPVFLVGLATAFNWRIAVISAVALPLIAIGLFGLYRKTMTIDNGPSATQKQETQAPASMFAFLRNPAIWLCFAFFAFVATALGGVQSFSPTIFTAAYDLPLALAAMSITLFMLASGVGMLAGGWLLTRDNSLERNITMALGLAVISALVIGSHTLPADGALSLMAIMGFGVGLAGPSRDMLIRSATPVGATGRVYGVVYSGLDLGIALGPLVFGRMLDHGATTELYYAVAGCLFLSLVTAWRVAIAAEDSTRSKHAR